MCSKAGKPFVDHKWCAGSSMNPSPILSSPANGDTAENRKKGSYKRSSDRRVRGGLENPSPAIPGSRSPECKYLEKFQAELTLPLPELSLPLPLLALVTSALDDSPRPHASFCRVCIMLAFGQRSSPSALSGPAESRRLCPDKATVLSGLTC